MQIDIIVQATIQLNASRSKMHFLQPKHIILKRDDVDKLLEKYNISLSQLPKIKITDAAIPEGASVGDIIKVERKEESGSTVYYRVVTL